MSSILDALEKLERTAPPTPGRPPAPAANRRSRRLATGALAIGAIAAAATLAWLGRQQGPAAPVGAVRAPAAAAAPETAPAVGAAPAGDSLGVARPVPVPAPDAAARPLALPIGPTFDTPAPSGTDDRAPLAGAALDAARGTPVPPADEPPAARQLAAAPRTAPPDTISSRPIPAAAPDLGTLPAGAPEVRVGFLLYSAKAERRSVALQLDGGPLTTLREGEEAQDVTVVRILPDRVELGWQGRRFAVAARN